LALASLTSSSEEVRRRVVSSCSIPEQLVAGLEHPNDGVKVASLKCFLSLSRSVKQLRSILKDSELWKLLLKSLTLSDKELLSYSLAVVCNVILDFSPAKELLVEERVLLRLVELTRHEDTCIRINAVWALMNATYQAGSSVKNELFESLGATQLFRYTLLILIHC
jgi:hypothetical protein